MSDWELDTSTLQNILHTINTILQEASPCLTTATFATYHLLQ